MLLQYKEDTKLILRIKIESDLKDAKEFKRVTKLSL